MNIKLSLILTSGIIVAQHGYDHFGTYQWLLALFLFIGTLLITRKAILYQCLNLYICVFCLGGLITAHEMDKERMPIPSMTQEELSSLDVTILKAHQLRKDFEHQMQSLGIEQQDFAVIAAMALGDKDTLSKDTQEDYSISGTSHILAVSGLHISIVFQLIVILLGGKRRSRLTLITSIIAIWAYVVFIGMPTSAIRSATMVSIYGFAVIAERHSPPLNTLGLAYLIMLLINPMNLFTLSFQMSFAAVGAILIFYPKFCKLYHPRHRLLTWSWQLLCVSLAAQLGTMPLIVHYFGRLSCYSLLTSFIAIPVATTILYLCGTLMLLCPLLYLTLLHQPISWLMHIIAHVLCYITQFANNTFHLISTAPGACIENIEFGVCPLLLSYVCLATFYLGWKKIEELGWAIKSLPDNLDKT